MMSYAGGLRLRLRHPVGPPVAAGGGFLFSGTSSIVINRRSAVGRITTSNKHNHALMTFAAAAEKSPVDLSPDRHQSVLSRQHKVDALLDTVKWDDKGLAVAIVQNVDTGAILMQRFANRDALALTISSGMATFYSRSRSKPWTKGETSILQIIYSGNLTGRPATPVPRLAISHRFHNREEADELCRTLEDNEDKSRPASEMADVLFHFMVLLSLRDVKMEDVLEILRHGFSRSGIEETESWTAD